MTVPRGLHISSRRCCGRLLSATWNAEGEGIWKCRRCGRTHAKRGSTANLRHRDVGRQLREALAKAEADASRSSTAEPTRLM